MIRPSFVLGAVCAWLVACGTDEPASMAALPAPPEQPRAREASPPPPAPRVVPESAPAQTAPPESQAPARIVAPARDHEIPDVTARDIGAELLTLIQEQSCLNLGFERFPSQGEVQIEVAAFVHTDGTIERARVTATGQPLPLLRCAEVRLTSTSLKGPVPGAPSTFKGSIVLAAREAREEQLSKPYRPPENLASPSGDYTFKGPRPPDYASRTSDISLKGARADPIAGPPD